MLSFFAIFFFFSDKIEENGTYINSLELTSFWLSASLKKFQEHPLEHKTLRSSWMHLVIAKEVVQMGQHV